MCGISTIINKDNIIVDPNLLDSMNNRIIHRGPDDSGIFVEGNIGLGHRRLSILDLSSAGHQPMAYQDYVIVYNGEIYNYIELKVELKQQGYTFTSETDTEVILAAYDHWGQDCLNHFNGMWSFVLYDKKKQVVFCSRDRFGIKPFCYTLIDNSIYIGSEVKQFLDLPGFDAQINKEIVYKYLVNNDLNTDENTFLQNVFNLKAGHQMVYDIKTAILTKTQWYYLNKVKPVAKKDITFTDASSKFVDLLNQSVTLRLRSDVKLGSCLSGGLDSSSIVCIAGSLMGKVHTVTSCYTQEGYDEQQFADLVNKKINSDPHKVYPDLNDLIEGGILEKINYHQDQPIFSASHFSEYKVFETAAENKLIVMLDGQGADEYLAGYGEFFMFFWKNLFLKGKFSTLYKEIEKRSKSQNVSTVSYLHRFANFMFLGNLKKKVLNKKSKSKIYFNDDFINKYAHIKSTNPGNTEEIKNIMDLSKHELLTYSLPYQLHSEDRNSMMHSVESRLPFLDYRLVEFCLSLPDDYKIRDGITKAILRKGMEDDLPEEIIHRYDKMGFVAPDIIWIKENPEIIKKELKDAVLNLKGIINENIIDEYENFIKGNVPYADVFFKAISLNHWMRAFNVSLNINPSIKYAKVS